MRVSLGQIQGREGPEGGASLGLVVDSRSLAEASHVGLKVPRLFGSGGRCSTALDPSGDVSERCTLQAKGPIAKVAG